MPLTISNNSAVASASYYLDKNQKALQMSIKRLASGKLAAVMDSAMLESNSFALLATDRRTATRKVPNFIEL